MTTISFLDSLLPLDSHGLHYILSEDLEALTSDLHEVAKVVIHL